MRGEGLPAAGLHFQRLLEWVYLILHPHSLHPTGWPKASVCRALPWFAQRGIQTDTRTWAKTEREALPPCPCLCWVFKPVLFWNCPVPWACPGEPRLGEMG